MSATTIDDGHPGMVTLRIGGRDGADAYPLDLERTDDGALVASIPASEVPELVRCVERAFAAWLAEPDDAAPAGEGRR